MGWQESRISWRERVDRNADRLGTQLAPGSSAAGMVLWHCPRLTSGRHSGVLELAPTNSREESLVHLFPNMHSLATLIWNGPWQECSPRRPERDPVLLAASPSHQEAPQASYPHLSEGRQDENHSHGKLTKLTTWITALSNSVKLFESYRVGSAKMNGSWWRVLTKHGPLEKGMANHFCILALRTPWTVWKGKKIGHWKMNSPGQ